MKTQVTNSKTTSAIHTLHYKAMESEMSFGLFTDMQAVRWLEELDYVFAPVELSSTYAVQLATACRTKLFNDEIERFTEEGRVVNLGCGFDTRGLFHDKKEWLDVDLPEIMDMRNDLSAGYGRVVSYNICGDVFDEVVLKSLVNDYPTLVLLEGFVDVYEREKVFGLLRNIRLFSKDLTVVLDACGSVFRQVPHPIQGETEDKYVIRFGLDSPKDLEECGYKVEKSTSVHEIAKDRWEPLEESYRQYPTMKEHSTKVIVLRGV